MKKQTMKTPMTTTPKATADKSPSMSEGLEPARSGKLRLDLCRPSRRDEPVLTLSPLAFLKLTYLCQAARTEVGGFGISRAADDLLYVQDVVLLKQTTTAVTVSLGDDAVADHFERFAEVGVPPAQCGRIWVHTHPGSSPEPSTVDEQTFARSFGGCDWSVMLILARGGAFYARLQLTAGPGAQIVIPVQVDWARWPGTLDESVDDWHLLMQEWQWSLRELVHERTETFLGRTFGIAGTHDDLLLADEVDPADMAGGFADELNDLLVDDYFRQLEVRDGHA